MGAIDNPWEGDTSQKQQQPQQDICDDDLAVRLLATTSTTELTEQCFCGLN